ncbi:hypothetical protein ACMD2_11675 [Ananas comosus]|uniref:Uncharacterized protein n=1 Tax=Ananas comosus TaxID=4615 RepID=A0A199V4A2_ANACO|nr:hypothetical protein ACMD2_11675 [Ananas comosus]
MPQVDLETLVCGGGGSDGKVSCETLIGGGGGEETAAAAAAAEDLDLPAESYRLRIGEDVDWTDVSAVYDRDDSTKGNTNPKSQQHQLANPSKARSNSQRFSGNLKAKAPPIIGLPGKIQHSSYLGSSARRPAAVRIFPKKARTGAGGRKPAVPESEPASPKVSCIGKVLSERERDRRRRRRRGSAEEMEEDDEGRSGCWGGLVAALRCAARCGGGGGHGGDTAEDSAPSPSRDSTANLGRVAAPEEAAPPQGPPGLGGMKRFASGRREASWGGDLGVEGDGRVAFSAPLDQEEAATRRRSVGSIEDAQHDSD